MAILQSDVRNRLLALLSEDDFAALAPHMERVSLPRLFILAETNALPAFCYFPESGLGSIVAVSPEGQKAEVGIFGNDGMTSTAAVLGAGSSPHEVYMQIEGDGFRIATVAVLEAIEAAPALRKLMTRYAQAMAVQTAYTAMSNSVHQVDERLARWILMCHDRSSGHHIALTHEFLSLMLAVRRPSVTTSLHVLEGNHFIKSRRGMVTILDRKALEEFADDAYGPPEREYERLVGPLKFSAA